MTPEEIRTDPALAWCRIETVRAHGGRPTREELTLTAEALAEREGVWRVALRAMLDALDAGRPLWPYLETVRPLIAATVHPGGAL